MVCLQTTYLRFARFPVLWMLAKLGPHNEAQSLGALLTMWDADKGPMKVLQCASARSRGGQRGRRADVAL